MAAGTGTTHDEAGTAPGRDGLERSRLEREPEVHRLDRVAEGPRARQVDHVAVGQQVDGPSVLPGAGS